MIKVNKHLLKIKPYKLSAHEAWDLSMDEKVLKLDWNEATQKPSPLVYERIQNALFEHNLNWYPNTNNYELIKKLADYSKVEESYVQYFASSDSLHEYILRAYISACESTNIVIVNPTYDNFRAVAESLGALIINYNLKKDFTIDYLEFNTFLAQQKPEIVYIVNPNNPTGTLHSAIELKNIFLENPNTLFVVDEAYYEFTGETMSEHITELDNLIITRTFSKAFALASFRIGYAIGQPFHIEHLNKIRNAKNVSLFAQEAAIAAMDDIAYCESYVQQVNKNKEIFEHKLSQFKWIKIFSGAGNFSFLEVIEESIKESFIAFMKTHKVFIRDYAHIESTKNCVRITIGLENQMGQVYKLILKFDQTLSNN